MRRREAGKSRDGLINAIRIRGYSFRSSKSIPPSQVNKPPVMLGDLPGNGIPLVQQQAVAKTQMLALRHVREVLLPEHRGEARLGPAKWIGGHQPIAANVP